MKNRVCRTNRISPIIPPFTANPKNLKAFLAVITVFVTMLGMSAVTVFANGNTGGAGGGGGDLAFFTSAIDTLKTLVIALGAGLGVWGIINLLEGYGKPCPLYAQMKRLT